MALTGSHETIVLKPKNVFQQEFMLEGLVNKYVGICFRFSFSNFEITVPVRTRKASKPDYYY